MPKRLHQRWICSIAVLAICCGCVRSQIGPNAAVPDEYRELYGKLKERIESFNAKLGAPKEGAAPAFSAELSTATSARGLALFAASTKPGVELELNRLAGLGLRTVTVTVAFPILSREFYAANGDPDDYDRVLGFYKQLAADIRARGLKLIVKAGLMFPGIYSAGSGLKLSEFYKAAGDRFAEYKAGHVATVVKEMKPDFLTVGAEPDIEAQLGSSAKDAAAFAVNVERYAKAARANGGTRVGAGVGTWQKGARDYIAKIAPYVDFIDLHVYPVDGNLLANAASLADYAAELGKPAAISEAWLMKEDTREMASVDSTRDPKIFARDALSFWSPLDQEFLAALAHLAYSRNMLFVSPFWTRYFWAYLNPGEAGSDAATMQHSAAAAAKALQRGAVSDTGKAYGLIAKGLVGKGQRQR